jgi:hypothetical protein
VKRPNIQTSKSPNRRRGASPPQEAWGARTLGSVGRQATEGSEIYRYSMAALRSTISCGSEVLDTGRDAKLHAPALHLLLGGHTPRVRFDRVWLLRKFGGMSDSIPETLGTAISFASALDRCAFDEAGPFLCDECVYLMGAGRTVGGAAIVDSYRENAEWAKTALDEINYESDVRLLDDGRAEIIYTDHIFHRGQRHTYRCCQILSFDQDGLISQIEHSEIDRQREELDAFLGRCGVDRNSS